MWMPGMLPNMEAPGVSAVMPLRKQRYDATVGTDRENEASDVEDARWRRQPEDQEEYGRWLTRNELQDTVLVKDCTEIFQKRGMIVYAMWVFQRAPDTRRDQEGTRGIWWVGGNSMFIKFAEESALVRRPGMPGPVPVFSQTWCQDVRQDC